MAARRGHAGAGEGGTPSAPDLRRRIRPDQAWPYLPPNSLPEIGHHPVLRAIGLPRKSREEGEIGSSARPPRQPVSLLRYDNEISVLSRLRTKALIGDEQGGARGYQRGNALKRFRREFDAVKGFGGGLVRAIRG